MRCKVCGRARQLGERLMRFTLGNVIEPACWRCVVTVSTGKLPPERR